MRADKIREDLIEKVTLEFGLKFIILTRSLCLFHPTSAKFTFILPIMRVHRHKIR